MKFEENQALIKADAQSKKIIIRIRGPVSGRRRLLAVIRSDFEHIHQDYKFGPQEMIPVTGYPDLTVPYEKLKVLEADSIETFHEVTDGKLLTLHVQDLLSGVDLEGSRKPLGDNELASRAPKLFYSYSHKDEYLRDELDVHLKLLHRQGLIDPWSDRNIDAGDEWEQAIDQNLEDADIILLIVSANFMASDYCFCREMNRALERHATGTARVIPIIVRDVDWKHAPFSQLQVLPTGGKAVTAWRNRDSAWRDISEGLRNILQKMPSG